MRATCLCREWARKSIAGFARLLSIARHAIAARPKVNFMLPSQDSEAQVTALIIVGSAGLEPWSTIERLGQEPTWAAEQVPGAHIVWMEADSRRDSSWFLRKLDAFGARRYDAFRTHYNLRDVRGVRDFLLSWIINRVVRIAIGRPGAEPIPLGAGRRIRFPYPSLYHLAPLRSAAYLRYALENFEFDFLLRVTSTCYVDIPQLMRFLGTAQRNGLYAGDVYTKRKVPFVGGAAILFSRDVVRRLVDNEESMRLDVHEDVSYGELLSRRGIAQPTQIGRVDASGKPMREIVKPPSVSGLPFVYRCKVAETWTDRSEPVVSLLFDVHKSIVRARGRRGPG